MGGLSSLSLRLRAVKAVGLAPAYLYASHHFGLVSGWYRLTLPDPKRLESVYPFINIIHCPDRSQIRSVQNHTIIHQADRILQDGIKIYGRKESPPDWINPGLLQHWTVLENRGLALVNGEDIKDFWEPARFGWAITLAMAYSISEDEQYPEFFWKTVDEFTRYNPPYWGVHWTSGQEIAIRLISILYAVSFFSGGSATTAERLSIISKLAAWSATRIQLTLRYSRAQNNNHLLSEAIGLIAAGLCIPGHPKAKAWVQYGERTFDQGILSQVSPEGEYVQHSVNYHRIMLQLGLIRAHLHPQAALPGAVRKRLGSAAQWLGALIDTNTGGCPNLGANDGAYILPLTSQPFTDHRPVVQAACSAFGETTPIPNGPWDDMRIWFGFNPAAQIEGSSKAKSVPGMVRLDGHDSHLFLRAAQYSSRPFHSDQLHVDLWWRGKNILRDAGTYSYNQEHPWNNSLVSTDVHNTVMVDQQDPMRRAGKFLWLDWAQATPPVKDGSGRWQSSHHGYSKLGVVHKRIIEFQKPEVWSVTDTLESTTPRNEQFHTYRIQWLLPDWEYQIEGNTLQVSNGALRFSIQWVTTAHPSVLVALYRAGKSVYGNAEAQERWGWYSPTYGILEPSLSLAISGAGALPLHIETRILLE